MHFVTAPTRGELHDFGLLSLARTHREVRHRLLADEDLLYVVLLNCLLGRLLKHLLQIEYGHFVLKMQLFFFFPLKMPLFLAVVKSRGLLELRACGLSVLEGHESACHLGVPSFATCALV